MAFPFESYSPLNISFKLGVMGNYSWNVQLLETYIQRLFLHIVLHLRNSRLKTLKYYNLCHSTVLHKGPVSQNTALPRKQAGGQIMLLLTDHTNTHGSTRTHTFRADPYRINKQTFSLAFCMVPYTVSSLT